MAEIRAEFAWMGLKIRLPARILSHHVVAQIDPFRPARTFG